MLALQLKLTLICCLSGFRAGVTQKADGTESSPSL
jgi:hypothetical protein